MKPNVQRLLNAVRAVYYSAHWTPDREVDAEALWTELRDAAGFEPGKAPEVVVCSLDASGFCPAHEPCRAHGCTIGGTKNCNCPGRSEPETVITVSP